MEVIFINNLILDMLLIVATLFVRRRKTFKGQVIFASLIGAIFALGYCFVPKAVQIVFKVVLAPFMVIIFDRYESFKSYISSLFIFIIFTYCLGGVVEGLKLLLDVDINSKILTGIIALAVLICSIGVKTLLFSKSKNKVQTLSVILEYQGQKILLKGMCDNGNTLTDSYSGLPVVILSNSAKCKLSGLDDGKKLTIDGFIEIKTVSGQSSLPIIKADRLKICDKDYSAYVAISEQDFQ